VPICGNGAIEPPELCDDQNDEPDDGCFECEVEPGYICDDEPSECEPIPPQVVFTEPNLGIEMHDEAYWYDGTLDRMDCVAIEVGDNGFPSVERVEVTIHLDHPYVEDLIIKVASPVGTITTLMNRPGYDEPADTYDEENNGNGADVVATHPVTFRDQGAFNAEIMGDGLDNSQAVCRDNARCDYFPSPGMGEGTNLGDFQGEDPVGEWRVCFGDGDDVDRGTIQQVVLSVLSW